VSNDRDVRINVACEVRFALEKAIGILDRAIERLRNARTESEQEAIGTEIEGFIRRLALGALALGNPSGGGAEIGGRDVKEKP